MSVKAPELPKGYFFRVSRGTTCNYHVSLRKELLGHLISYEVDFWATDYSDDIPALMERLKKYLDVKKDQKKYLGDYPPKKNIGGED